MTTPSLAIGYIGLGVMGKSIARNILKAGYKVTVHNRSQGSVQELVAEGATAATSPAEVAAASDVIFTNMPDTETVLQVALGPGGVIEGIREGSVFIDNSTSSTAVAIEIAQKLSTKGAHALDAPVSGGDIGARNGTLSIMVGGGDEAILERVRPVLESTSRTITYLGSTVGSGQVTKACNQIMCAAQYVAMGEMLVLAEKSGVDPLKMVQAVKGGAAQCWTLDNRAERLLSGNRSPGGKVRFGTKDLGIALDIARLSGVALPLTAVNEQINEAAVQRGDGDLDWSAVIGPLEDMAGVTVGPKQKPEGKHE